MWIVGVASQKNAEKSGKPKAYLARLSISAGAVQREFAKPVKQGANLRSHALRTSGDEIFEARHWNWNGESYVGGTTWFSVDGNGRIRMLDRDAAMAMPTGIAGPEATAIASPGAVAERIQPDALTIRRLDA